MPECTIRSSVRLSPLLRRKNSTVILSQPSGFCASSLSAANQFVLRYFSACQAMIALRPSMSGPQLS